MKVLLSLGAAVAAAKLAHMASSLGMDDVLGTMGLTRRKSRVFESIVLFGAGAAVGAGATLLLAPASGHVTRARLGKEISKLSEATTEAVRDTTMAARALVHGGNDAPTGAKPSS
jgi:hypothetical protein